MQNSFTPKLPISPRKNPRVLTVAGSDSGGGAGVQADLKSIAAHGGYGLSAIASLTAQNTQGVRAIHSPGAAFLTEQLEAISDDITVDALKIGMLGSIENIEALKVWLKQYRPPVVVLDPVMVSTSGHRLIDDDAEQALRGLFDFVDVVTPNVQELKLLAGVSDVESSDFSDLLKLGRAVAEQYDVAVLVKGGHCEGEEVRDALVVPGQEGPAWSGSTPRVHSNTTHGTGCSLSSALATLLAQTGDWNMALSTAKRWLTTAIEHGEELEVGKGHGPIHHFHHLQTPKVQDYSQSSLSAEEIQSLRENFSETVWQSSANIRRQVDESAFVKALGSGSLSPEAFIYYLDQDALYLNIYSRALAQISARAQDTAAQLFYAHSAFEAIEVESELHRTWMSRYAGSPWLTGAPSESTDTYGDFLLARTSRSYAEGVAAVLPCYWLYAEIGLGILKRAQESQHATSHPYQEWLDTYAAEDFQEATRLAKKYADDAAAQASDAELLDMKNAFMRACLLELEFFDAPLRRVTC